MLHGAYKYFGLALITCNFFLRSMTPPARRRRERKRLQICLERSQPDYRFIQFSIIWR